MVCPACGAAYAPGTRYCGGCGLDLRTAPQRAGMGAAGTPGSSPATSPAAGTGQTTGTLRNGRYQITAILSSGSFGRVYRAENTLDPDSPPLAIKEILTANLATPDEQREAVIWFKREVSTLLSLDHPAIPAIHSHWTASHSAGPLYLAMDYIPGKPLAAVQQQTAGRLTFLVGSAIR